MSRRVGARELELGRALCVDLEERLAAYHDVAECVQEPHAGGHVGGRAGPLRDPGELRPNACGTR